MTRGGKKQDLKRRKNEGREYSQKKQGKKGERYIESSRKFEGGKISKKDPGKGVEKVNRQRSGQQR